MAWAVDVGAWGGGGLGGGGGEWVMGRGGGGGGGGGGWVRGGGAGGGGGRGGWELWDVHSTFSLLSTQTPLSRQCASNRLGDGKDMGF